MAEAVASSSKLTEDEESRITFRMLVAGLRTREDPTNGRWRIEASLLSCSSSVHVTATSSIVRLRSANDPDADDKDLRFA